jgi:hypothetical protein
MTGPAHVDRSRLPDPKPTRTFPFPAIEKSTLQNGMRVWTVRHTQVPLVAFTLLMRRGAAADPPGQEGLAAVTADMLDEGSGDRSAIEMHEGLARLGAQFDTDIGSDATVASHRPQPVRPAGPRAVLGHRAAGAPGHDFTRVRQLRLHRLTVARYAGRGRRSRLPVAGLRRAPLRPSPMGNDLARRDERRRCCGFTRGRSARRRRR